MACCGKEQSTVVRRRYKTRRERVTLTRYAPLFGAVRICRQDGADGGRPGQRQAVPVRSSRCGNRGRFPGQTRPRILIGCGCLGSHLMWNLTVVLIPIDYGIFEESS